jgi:ribosome-associated toxin RatA of RatAB toxin-antitoxin module
MKFLAIFILTNCLLLASSQAQEEPPLNTIGVTVNRVREGDQDMFELRATGFVAAPPDRVWKVLTDYDRLPDFVPNLLSSKVLSHTGQESVIDQTGVSRFLFVKKTIHLVVRAVEVPMSRIDVSLVSGDMKRYAVRWELSPGTANAVSGTRLTYSGMLEPNFYVPPLIGPSVMQDDVQRMMQAVVTEILKKP